MAVEDYADWTDDDWREEAAYIHEYIDAGEFPPEYPDADAVSDFFDDYDEVMG